MPIIRNAQRKAAEYQQGLDYPKKLSRTESKVVDTAVVAVGFQSVADEAARLATGLTAGALVYQQDNDSFYKFSGTFSGSDGYSLVTDWELTQLGPDEWQNSVITAGTFDPPALPTAGDRYLIGLLNSDTGLNDWVGKQTQIAEWDGSVWTYIIPTTGSIVSVDDDTSGVHLFGGADWTLKLYEATTASGNLVKTVFDIDIIDNPSFTGTEAIGVPVGTTAQRSGSAADGDIRYNSDNVEYEGYQSGSWSSLGGGAGLTSVDSLVSNATATAPGAGLPAAADGQIYILVNNTGSLHVNWGTITGVGDGDAVEYKGSSWQIAVDVSDTTVTPVIIREDTSRLNIFTGGFWQESQASVHTTLGVGVGVTNMGSYTGSTITPSQSAKQNIQALETSLEINDTATGLNTSKFVTGGVTLKQAVSADRTVLSGESYFHPRMHVGAGETVTVASGGYMLSKSDVIAATGTVTVDAGGLWEII